MQQKAPLVYEYLERIGESLWSAVGLPIPLRKFISNCAESINSITKSVREKGNVMQQIRFLCEWHNKQTAALQEKWQCERRDLFPVFAQSLADSALAHGMQVALDRMRETAQGEQDIACRVGLGNGSEHNVKFITRPDEDLAATCSCRGALAAACSSSEYGRDVVALLEEARGRLWPAAAADGGWSGLL
eukprot:m.308580 g.308580  ORF g.308580 m.308580 type:complete len:189 (+) comp23029_c0_seq2:1169-1735(+)